MPQYLYLASNTSMPGTIKVGRTEKLPSQRVAELHTTSVPTPFEIELSLEVNDCVAGEKAAHHALAEYRVSGNREFFKVPVEVAVKKILPAIGSYKIKDIKSSNSVNEIEQELERRRRESQRRSAEHKAKVHRRREMINASIAEEKRTLEQLGPKPEKEELPGVLMFFWATYFPFPFGGLVWLMALSVFNPETRLLGLVCIGSLVCGYFVNEKLKKIDEDYEKRAEPFREPEERLRKLEAELRDLENQSANERFEGDFHR